jgi:cell shape-determining protein MreC
MNTVKSIILFFLFTTFLSCENKTEKEIEEIDEVLKEGHDSVMPKSMVIGTIKKDMLTSVEASSDSLKNAANATAAKLQKAEDDMYTWMEDYGKALNDIKDQEEKLKLYKLLKDQIEQIRKDTDSSIEEAKKLTALPK